MALSVVDDLVVEAGQRGPLARDLGRVDHDAGAPQRRQGRDVVAVPSQRSTSATSSGLRAGLRAALVVDDGHGAGEHVGVGLVEHDEHVGVALLEVALRLGLVVEAQHGGRGAAAHDAPARLEARRRTTSKPKARRSWAGGSGWMRRRASVMTPSVPSLPTKSWVRFGPGRGAGALALGAHDAAVGQHHLEADDHVLDLPVARRVLPGAPAGQPAAHRREVHRLGPVAERVAVADPAQRLLEVGAEGARPARRR